MKILAIETSCDETALSIIETDPIRVLGNVLISQTKIHEEYGGVFPMIAKREHVKNLTPLLHKVLLEAGLYAEASSVISQPEKIEVFEKVKKILEREDGLFEALAKLMETTEKPRIDMIAVTEGPGLEPALWVGLSFAKALSLAWNIPVIGVNHMEGHIAGSFLQKNDGQKNSVLVVPEFPALALLISGGHTELVLVKKWGDYQIVGKTLDDAVGEAFDKVARLLGLEYPGGPLISRLAAADRVKNPIPISHTDNRFKLPRPMLHSHSLDFSFSGIKTAVRYMVQGGQQHNKQQLEPLTLSEENTRHVAREFEDAVTEVLIAKTREALEKHPVKTLVLGGGVTANDLIRSEFTKLAAEFSLPLLLPTPDLSTDNALMIALAAHLDLINTTEHRESAETPLKANGNLSL